MFRAIVRKELRQLSIVLAASAAATIIAACIYAAAFQGGIPFLNPHPVQYYAMAVGLVAVGIGLTQAYEFEQRSSLFLLHLPIQRRDLVLSKIKIGIGCLLIICTVPILFVAILCSFQLVAAPFFWSMTGDVWLLIATATVIYLGAFLSGIRPAKWYGTRLLPIAGAAALAISIHLVQLVHIAPHWWIFGLALLVGIDWLLMETIAFIADSRDYA